MSGAPTGQFIPNWPDQAQLDEFAAAIGRAISRWQYVEAHLYQVCLAAVQPRNPEAFSALFHQLQTFNVKLSVTDMAVGVVLIGHPTEMDQWKRLKKKMNSKNDRRNEIAHFSYAVKPWGKGKNDVVRLVPQILDARYTKGLKGPVDLRIEEVKSFDRIFFDLGNEVMEFSNTLRPIAKGRPPKPPGS